MLAIIKRVPGNWFPTSNFNTLAQYMRPAPPVTVFFPRHSVACIRALHLLNAESWTAYLHGMYWRANHAQGHIAQF